MNVAIINGSSQYAALFRAIGFNVVGALDDADLVCFTGGADVSPHLYGDQNHPFTGTHPERDKMEAAIFDICLNKGVPMVGICRGAQFLNVMSGGRMYQHVEKHTRAHEITDLQTGEVVYVSSTHHQMMMPSPEALLVASSHLGGSREWYDGQVARRDVSDEDIEVVYYEKTKCLCFQPHPEFDDASYAGMRKYFKGLLSKYLQAK